MQFIAQGGAFGEQLDRAQRGRADGGGHGVGEQIGAGLLPQQIDDFLARRRVTAARAAQRLAEGAGQNVDAAFHARVFRGAAPVRAHKAHGVAVVHHHQRAEFIGQIANGGQVGDKAVHGEHAVGGDQLDAGVLRLEKLFAQVGHVVVAVAQALRLAQAHAIDDGGVV